MFENLDKIVFISSESCNLHCSYCHLAKKATQCHQKETEKIKESFKSGQYLQLYKDFINKYNIDINKIKKIELWGQEPTLTLDEFNTQIFDILDWLPNAKRFLFSTNGVSHIDRLINCINIFNKYFENNKREFYIHFQFSFDGFDYIKDQRGIEPEVIVNNVKKFLYKLNNIQLNNNLQVSFNLHGVIDIPDIISQLEDKEESYWSKASKLLEDLNKINTNKKVVCYPFTTFFVVPYNATKQDGQYYSIYAKKCIQNQLNHMNPNTDQTTPFIHILQGIQNILGNDMIVNHKESKDIYQFFNGSIDSIEKDILSLYDTGYNNNPDFCNIINYSYSCKINNQNLKIRYNGDLLYCEQTMFDLSEEDMIGRDQFDYDLVHYQLKHPRFQPNIFTSNQEDVEKFLSLFNSSYRQPYLLSYSNIVNFMYLLLQNDQIDESYKDINKLLRHALYVAKARQCYRASMVDTGSFYTETLGFIRLCCNGLLDYLESLYLNHQLDLNIMLLIN